jgi:hypothetical protein
MHDASSQQHHYGMTCAMVADSKIDSLTCFPFSHCQVWGGWSLQNRKKSMLKFNMIFDAIFDRFGSDLGAMLGATSLKNRRKNELCIEVLFLLDF